MSHPGRKWLQVCALLVCGILLSGGVMVFLRPVAAKGKVSGQTAAVQPETATEKRPALPDLAQFKSVPETGAITVRAAGRGTPNLYFKDGHDVADPFETLRKSGSGLNPLTMVNADATGDSQADVVTTYGAAGGDAYVTVRLYDGHGKFTDSKVTKLNHGMPVAAAIGNLTPGLLPDLAVVSATDGTLSILNGDGEGNFNGGVDLKVGAHPTSLEIADVRANGLFGLVVGDADGEFRVIGRTDSEQSFTDAEMAVYRADAGVVAVKAADLNRDGIADLAVATTAGVELWLGNGKGGFARDSKLAVNGTVASLALADMNLDTVADIAAVTTDGVVNAWFSRKGGGFDAVKPVKAADSAVAVRIDWMDVDPFRDVVVVDKANSRVSVLTNKKGLGLGLPVALDVDGNPVDVAMGKFDIDGANDMIVAKERGASQALALTYQPNQASTIAVTSARGTRAIPISGTVQDILNLPAGTPVSLLDAVLAANNTPGPQTIVFQISENSVAGITPANINLREPPTPGTSINPFTPYGIIPGISGNIQYTIDLRNLPNISFFSLILTSPNGDGTVIVGENVAGVNSLGETVLGNINKSGPDIRIIGSENLNNGFEIGAANCRLESLTITGFNRGATQNSIGASAIEFSGVNAQNNIVNNCYLGGIDLNGLGQFFGGTLAVDFSFALINDIPAGAGNIIERALVGNRRGIRINGAGNTTITATAVAGQSADTIIAGNADHGILFEGGSATNTVSNCNIGLLRDDLTPFGNAFTLSVTNPISTVEFRNNATGNVLRNNFITASGQNGLFGPLQVATARDAVTFRRLINATAGPSNNRLEGNIIGLRGDRANPPLFRDGTANPPVARNTGYGVSMADASTFNTLNENTISANVFSGILISGLGTNRNSVVRNRIGTNDTGSFTNGGNPANNNRGNLLNGLEITENAAINTVDGNVISNNLGNGISITCSQQFPFPTFQGTDGNTIVNNRIGTDAGATPTALGANLANGFNGIVLGDPTAVTNSGNVQLNVIDRNLVFFNILDGINFTGQNCDFNTITRSSIVGNGQRGIRIATTATGPGPAAGREGPETVSGFQTAQEKYTVTNTDGPDGAGEIAELPDIPAPPVNLPTTAIRVVTATVSGTTLNVTGIIGRGYSATPNSLIVEVFASNTNSQNARSRGVAQRFIGQTTVPGNVSPATWSASFPNAQVQVGETVTATLRSPNGSTSEIAIGRQVEGSATPPTLSVAFFQVTNTTNPVTLTPLSGTLNLGTQQQAGQTLTATVRVVNNGAGPVTINSIQITNPGGSPAQFAVQQPNGLPVTLNPTTSNGAADGFLDFVVSSTPTAGGVQTGALGVNVTFATPVTLGLTLTATGVAPPPPQAPQIQVAPASLDFGAQQQNTTSGIQNVTVTNTGTGTLNISVALSSSDFLFDSSLPATSISINAGLSATIPVRFRPSLVGTRTGTLSINTNVTTTPLVTVPLTGTGTAPPTPVFGGITVNGQPAGGLIDFGNVPVNQTRTITATLSNTGNAALAVQGTISGDAFNGSLSTNSIPAGGTGTLTVTFSPQNTGNFVGQIVLATNDPTTPNVTIQLRGVGAAANINVSPLNIPFGTVNVGSTSPAQTIIITNTGNDVLTVNTLNISPAAFQLSGATTPLQIQPNSSQPVLVTFRPTTPGQATGVLTIGSNARNTPVVNVTLSGTGQSLAPPVVQITEPGTNRVFATGSNVNVGFRVTSDNQVTAIDVQFSDGGAFNSVASLAGSATSFTFTLPQNLNTTNARFRVIARDNNGNTGQADSSAFTVATPPQITSVAYRKNGKLLVRGSNVQLGAVLVIRVGSTETTQPLTVKGSNFLTANSINSVIPVNTNTELSIRNPNGLTGQIIPFLRPAN